MKSFTKYFLCLLAVFTLLTSGLLFFSDPVIHEDDPISNVDAAPSEEKDSYGYMWVDNNGETPRIEFDWIDATIGTHLSDITTKSSQSQCSGSSNNLQLYQLPFTFEFYDESYSEVNVMAYGTLDFGSYYGRYTYQIPSTSYGNAIICPLAYHIGASQYQGAGKFKVYALEGEDIAGKWVCFQWDNVYYSNCYTPITFQAILYQSGLIKFQYLDMETTYPSSSYGQRGICGIEDHTGSVALVYSSNQPLLRNGLAVMFGKEIAEVGSVTIDSDDNGMFYSMHRDYSVEAEVFHPINNDMIRVVSMDVGDGLVKLYLFQNPDGSYFFSKTDPNGFLSLVTKKCSVEESNGWLKIKFVFAPTFNFPVLVPLDLEISVQGVGIMPGTTQFSDGFTVENRLELSGAPEGFSETTGYIENDGWIKGSEEFHIRGIKPVYPGTSKCPKPGSFSLTLRDTESGEAFIQDQVDGYCDIVARSENDHVSKVFRILITDVPQGIEISDPVFFYLNIDPYKPSQPRNILLHADSYSDRIVAYDNDNEVFVSWEPSEDFESGIAGYYVSTSDPYDTLDLDGESIFVEYPDTTQIIEFDEIGMNRVYVWAVDRAGNPSIPTSSLTMIDTTEVTFSEFSPGNQVWVNTRTPVCSVLIDDIDGSGVSAKNLQFSVSTTNTLEFSAWQSSTLSRDAEQIRLSMKALFQNGKNNWVRFRAKDVAGNGWTYSQNYNIWVDEEKPSYVNFRPFEIEYQNGKNVVVSVDITDTHSTREGSGISIDTVEYRTTIQGTGLFGDWIEAPISSIDRNGIVHVEMELQFREGIENFIQFRCYDDVGNFAGSKQYNIKVNTAPVVEAFLSEPNNGHVHTTSEKILFDASATTDPDGDDLTFTWYSDINGFLSGSDSFFRTLSPGVHVITLVVNDPAHSMVTNFDIEVLEEAQIDPMDIDTDGDGIYDDWELRYNLDPYRPDSFIDTDQDKFTNFQEFQNGTDPTRSVSHPPYPDPIDVNDPLAVDDTDEQYQSITLALVLVAVMLIIILVLLAFSKRRNFALEREEQKELEKDEVEYRSALIKKND